MSNVESIVDSIHSLEEGYRPRIDNAEQIFGDITLVSVLGPLCVGKTDIISDVAKLDPEFGRVTSFITLPQRSPGVQDVYNMIEHTADNLEGLRDMALAGQLVRFAVHPISRYVYGSMAQDYRHRFSMLDIIPPALASVESLPFKDVKRLAITATADEWQDRLKLRLRLGRVDNLSVRLKDALDNINWALDQSPDDITWVTNGASNKSTAAQYVTQIVRDGRTPDPSARKIAIGLQARISEILAA